MELKSLHKAGLNQSNKEEYIINLVANYKEKLATT
jgi:hypothetical protein